MDKENKLIDYDRLDCKSKFTKAVPQKIMASDLNPNGVHLYIEQRAYIAKELELQGYGDTRQAVREFAYKFKDRCVMELKPLEWEYGEGAEDVLRIFNKVLSEVTGK